MIRMRLLPLCALGSALLCSAAIAQSSAPAARIVSKIDESQLVTLKGNVNPNANAQNDRGPVSASLSMTGMVLVLSRSPEQQAAFDAYVASEYDPSSPNYHQWLTPAEVGARFGPAESDIATISKWLTSHGLSIDAVAPDRMSIRFTGTAGQAESAFHTEIHNLLVNGRMHIANMTEPQIPAALAPVVVGVKGLHNFFPHPLHHMGHMVERDPQTGKWLRQVAAPSLTPRVLGGTASAAKQAHFNVTATPQFGISVGGSNPYTVEDVGPWDFATIYNVAPLWNAGIDGTGQTIAIAGTSAIDIGESSTQVAGANGSNDVATFRTFFNLPTSNSYNTPIQISGNSEPLHVCTDTTGNLPYPSNPCELGDLEENTLDVEWSGAVAKNAQIVLVASYPSSESDDSLYDSESYIVDHLTARIMNVSYGECELGMGTAGNVAYYDLWQTAAAEGIAVFVAAGDSGAASCDDGGDGGGSNLPYAAEYGLTVSGLATSPYDTAVGGTDFNWCPLTTSDGCASEAATYWNTTNNSPNESNAKGYVPELPWNDTCTSPLALPFLKSFFSGVPYLGTSNQQLSVTDAETGCNAIAYYASQLQQDGDGVLLYLDDTVGGSGGASNCVANSTDPASTTGQLGACSAGATSTGPTTNPDTGAAQASLTLVNDGWPKPSWQAGVPGIPADGVRDIPDVSFFASDGFLSSSAYLVCVSAASQDPECTYSTSSEPFAQEVGGTSVATPAMAGVMALIDQKAGAAQGSPNAELYALAAKQNYGNCSAENGSTSSGCYFNDIDQGTIAMTCDYDGYVATPSPNCAIAHAGDYFGILSGFSATTGYDEATGLGSLNVANLVNAWQATTGTAAATVTVTPQSTSINSSDTLSVTVSVSGPAGTPTGTITLTGGGYTPTAETIGTSPCASASNCVFTIPANTFAAGTVTLTANFSGDENYASGSGQAQITVNQSTLPVPTITVTSGSETINSNASLNVTVSVSGTGAAPTGTIILSGGGITSGGIRQAIGTNPCTSASSCVFTIPANTLSAGPDTLTATYSGDGNYASASANTQVSVTESTFTLAAGTPSPSSVAPGSSAKVAVTVASVAGYTGTVSLTCQQTSSTASGGDGTTCTGGGSATAVNLSTCGSNCSVTFTIGSTAPIAAALERPQMPGGRSGRWLGAGSGAILALLVFFGIPARRRAWRSMLGIVVAMAMIGFMSSCGGGSTSSGGTTGGGSTGGGGQSDPGTTAGTYTYTVTATPSPSVSPTVKTTFTVTVN